MPYQSAQLRRMEISLLSPKADALPISSAEEEEEENYSMTEISSVFDQKCSMQVIHITLNKVLCEADVPALSTS